MGSAIPLIALLEAIAAAYTSTPVAVAPISSRFISRTLCNLSIQRGFLTSDNAQVSVYGVDLPNEHSGQNVQTFAGDGVTSKFDFSQANVVNGVANPNLYVAWANYNFVLRVGDVVVPYRPVSGQAYAGYNITDNAGGTNAALPARVNLQGGSATGDGSTTVFNTGIADAARILQNSRSQAVMVLNVFLAGVLQPAAAYALSVTSGQTVLTFGVAPLNTVAITWQLAPAAKMKVNIYAFPGIVPPSGQPQSAPDVLLAATTAGVAQKEGEIQTRDLMWAVITGSTVGPTNVYLRPSGI